MRSMALSRHDGPLCPGSSGSYGAARLGGGESLSMGHGALCRASLAAWEGTSPRLTAHERYELGKAQHWLSSVQRYAAKAGRM